MARNEAQTASPQKKESEISQFWGLHVCFVLQKFLIYFYSRIDATRKLAKENAKPKEKSVNLFAYSELTSGKVSIRWAFDSEVAIDRNLWIIDEISVVKIAALGDVRSDYNEDF
ncbi:hypothetical protein G9A89_022957 [Geosiphon pyriformis]|nr:hypothetical protein G9A89_022957 [Geosiphon pyriformis]